MKKTCVCVLVLLILFCSFASAADENRFVFSTTDIKGNETDESILEGYDIVLFNVWEPWCGPCVREMPALEKYYQMYKNKNVLIVGLVNRAVYPGFDPEEVVSETGVSYPVLNYCSEFDPFFTELLFPASLFMDEKGHVIDVLEYVAESKVPAARADARDYAAGAYDRYLNDPAYAQYQPLFELLKSAAEGGEEEILALARYYALEQYYGTDTLYGSLSDESWGYVFNALVNG